jgi:hypothetical protein
MKIGDKVKVIERTYTGEVFEWDGEIVKIEDVYVETKHCRNYITHPQWRNYNRAYEPTWIKHYYHPDGKLNNIKCDA